MAIFGPLLRGQPHSPNVSHCICRPKGHWKPCNKVGSLSLAKQLVRFEPGTLKFWLQCVIYIYTYICIFAYIYRVVYNYVDFNATSVFCKCPILGITWQSVRKVPSQVLFVTYFFSCSNFENHPNSHNCGAILLSRSTLRSVYFLQFFYFIIIFFSLAS